MHTYRRITYVSPRYGTRYDEPFTREHRKALGKDSDGLTVLNMRGETFPVLAIYT